MRVDISANADSIHILYRSVLQLRQKNINILNPRLDIELTIIHIELDSNEACSTYRDFCEDTV